MNTQQAAAAYIARGWAIVPLLPRKKKPIDEDWPIKNYAATDLYQNGNIGVKLGIRSGGLVDVDLDMPEAIVEAFAFLPETPCVFGRPGSLRSHRLYICPNPGGLKKWKLNKKVTIVELRATGGQTVFPPSIHEDTGELIAWDNGAATADPAVVEWTVLEKACENIARACGWQPTPAAAVPPPISSTPPLSVRPDLAVRRCLAYIAKVPDAISGQGGHDATLRAACECFRFGLDDGQARQVMSQFNATRTGGEQWTDREMEHKLADARKIVSAAGETGLRLREDRAPAPPASPADVQPAGSILSVNVSDKIAPIDNTLTDSGNSSRFLRQHGHGIRYCGPWDKFLKWDGTRWRPADAWELIPLAQQTARRVWDEAKNEADPDRAKAIGKWAAGSLAEPKLKAMISLARAACSVHVEDLDRDPFLFNCANGTLNLADGGVLQPHDPADLLTKLAPVTFDAAATSALWQKFLARIFPAPDGLILAYLQRVLGMCLTADIGEQHLWIAWGKGNNGKSVLLDTVLHLMGDYACPAMPSLLMETRNQEHPTEVADMCGKRLVLASENDEGARLKVQLVKRLTGDSDLKARRLYGDPFQFKRTQKMILLTNNKPIIRESSEAVSRRLRLLPFTVAIPPEERDPNLIQKLTSEWPAILNWLTAGCLLWMERGLEESEGVLTPTREYLGDQDPLAEFLAEKVTFQPHSFTAKRDLNACYVAWAQANGESRPLGPRAVTDRLRAMPGIGEDRRRIGESMTRGFTGIAMNSPASTENQTLYDENATEFETH